MSKVKTEVIDKLFSILITFPNVPQKAEDQKEIFDKIVLLLEKSQDSFPKGLILKKGKRKVLLDSDDYMFFIELKKQLPVRILVNKPDENIATVNKVGNSIINFLNTILEERAKGAKSISTKLLLSDKPINYASKIIGTSQLAKINEVVKETVQPIAITFTYEREKRRYFISSSYSKKKNQNSFALYTDYDGTLPFDLLQNEYKRLNDPSNLLIKIATEL